MTMGQKSTRVIIHYTKRIKQDNAFHFKLLFKVDFNLHKKDQKNHVYSPSKSIKDELS